MTDPSLTSRRAFLGTAALLPAAAAAAQSNTSYADFSNDPREPDMVVPLWPKGGMPGGPPPTVTETIDDQWDTSGLRYRVAAHVTRPTLSYFAAAKPTGAAVLLIPGGGYARVGIDREGYECARWFNAHGIAAFVLRYRLPVDRWSGGAVVALQDAQRAMRLIRSGNAERWKVDVKRVTVMGGSAGGHLAGCLCVKVYDRTYAVVDAADHLLTRPDGAILLYPVVSMKPGGHAGSRLALLGPDPTPAAVADWSLDGTLPGVTPPIFLAHALHDRVVSVDQSLALFASVRASGGAIDMHLFEEGAHGLGLRGDPALPLSRWPEMALHWMARNRLS